MKNAHIAFVSFPHHPHVNPTIPIASVLVRRGYRVTYVTSDTFATRVAAIGAEVVRGPEFRVCEAPDERKKVKERFQSPFLRLADRTSAEISLFYEKNRPNLIVYDVLAFAGRILASRGSIPAVQTSPTFAHARDVHDLQVRNSSYRQEMLAWSKRADQFLLQHGIADSDFLFHREKLNIYLFPKALQPCASAIDASCFYAGRCAGEQPYYGNWQRSGTDGRPIALVATSTTYVRGPDYFKLCIEALSGLQWHVILSIGDSGDPESLMPLPPHFEIVQHTSHVKILRYVSLLVCLGGIVTSAEAAYHGVPMIVTSHGAPELEWEGENLEDLGLGIHLRDSELSVESLRRSAIEIAKDARVLERVRQMQYTTRREPGAEEAANRIQEYLETHSQ